MTEKISRSHFALGEDISEVRNQIDSIRQFLVDPNILSEISDLFIEKAQERREKEKAELLLQYEDDSQHEQTTDKGDKFFEYLETHREEAKKYFNEKFSQIIEPIVKKFADALLKRPMSVNVMQTAIIEFCFGMSQKPKGAKPFSLKNGEMVIKSFKLDNEDWFEKRLSLILPDWGRKLSIIQRNVTTALLTHDWNTLDSYGENVFSENLSNKDPMFGSYFALSLSQCSIYNINEFLDYQKEAFEGDFIIFLEVSLMKYGYLIADSHIVMAQKWMKNQVHTQIQVSEPNTNQIAVKKKWEKIDGSYFRDNYFHSDMDLGKADVKKFLNFLCRESNNAGQPFLHENEVIELIGIGFKIPQSGIPTQKFTLNINSKEIGKIYGCFHKLWQWAAIANNKGREFWCAYLHTYFTNFESTTVQLMLNSFRGKKPDYIGFQIKNYLPDEK
jgi:hypothetical protein